MKFYTIFFVVYYYGSVAVYAIALNCNCVLGFSTYFSVFDDPTKNLLFYFRTNFKTSNSKLELFPFQTHRIGFTNRQNSKIE